MSRGDCPHCGEVFDAPDSLRGGFVNCPGCGKASELRGGPEPLFWGLLGLGVLAAIGISLLAFAAAGWTGAVIAGAICAAVIVVVVLAS